MAHTALRITSPEVQEEVRYAWANSYSSEATGRALESIRDEPAAYKISHLMARLFFRGIYFPKKGVWQWLKLVFQNRVPVYGVVKDCFTSWHGVRGPATARESAALQCLRRERPLEIEEGKQRSAIGA
ncbi:MAG: hypothetical protein WDO73_28120 [Ignavibacteriota bacterium]